MNSTKEQIADALDPAVLQPNVTWQQVVEAGAGMPELPEVPEVPAAGMPEGPATEELPSILSIPTPLERILDAFRTEREYQVRRWGHRQPDGTFAEGEHPIADWIVYMRHWMEKAMQAMSTRPNAIDALGALRKAACLAWAMMEHDGYNLDGIIMALNIRQETRPYVPQPLGGWLLLVRGVLEEAARDAVQWERQGEAKAAVIDMLHACIGCFLQYGILPRMPEKEVTNAHDRRPA